MAKKSTSFWNKTVHPLYSSLTMAAGIVAIFMTIISMNIKPVEVSKVGTVAGASTGFDMYGYNDRARIFVGKADGLDKILDGKYYGNASYAADHLVMKWNSEWDRGNDEGWTDPKGYDAWIDNEWNGMVGGGSQETWHYKIVWDKGCKTNSTPTTKSIKGTPYCIWNQFAVVMSQGTYGGQHYWDVLAKPSGYGSAK